MDTRRRSVVLITVTTLWLALTAAPARADTWLETTPADPGPEARVGLAGNAYDPVTDRLIIFGGGTAALPRPTDTWLLHDATASTGTPMWEELVPSGDPPLGRFNHTSVYAPSSNRLIVYGGCAGNCSPALSDTWVLSNANGEGGTPTWTMLSTSGADAREGHAAIYDDASNRMIVFGGQNAFNSYASNPQVRVLTNADGTEVGTPTWSTLTPSGTPPSNRETSGAAYDGANNRLIVFGGATLACCAVVADVYNDVWVLTNANGLGGTPQWSQLTPSGTPPPARHQTSTLYDPASNRLIVVGGLNDKDGQPVTEYNDVWVLTNANGMGGTPEWVQLAPDGGPPPQRWGTAGGYNAAANALVVAMGRTGGSLLDDVWVLDGANGLYDFSGFFSPVNNSPTFNAAKAGGAIPVKFSLGGDEGLDIFATGYPRSRQIDCDTSATIDGVETTVTAGSSSLTYDADTDQYTYVWKTAKQWAGTCRRLEVKLDDASLHVADFTFR